MLPSSVESSSAEQGDPKSVPVRQQSYKIFDGKLHFDWKLMEEHQWDKEFVDHVRRCDVNSDGCIDADEFMVLMQNYLETRKSNVTMQDTIRMMVIKSLIMVMLLLGLTFMSSYLAIVVTRDIKTHGVELVNTHGQILQTDRATTYYDTPKGFFAQPVANYEHVFLTYTTPGSDAVMKLGFTVQGKKESCNEDNTVCRRTLIGPAGKYIEIVGPLDNNSKGTRYAVQIAEDGSELVPIDIQSILLETTATASEASRRRLTAAGLSGVPTAVPTVGLAGLFGVSPAGNFPAGLSAAQQYKNGGYPGSVNDPTSSQFINIQANWHALMGPCSATLVAIQKQLDTAPTLQFCIYSSNQCKTVFSTFPSWKG